MIVVSLTGCSAAGAFTFAFAFAVFMVAIAIAVAVAAGSVSSSAVLLFLLLDILYRSCHVSCTTSSGRPGTCPVGFGSKREGRRDGGGGSNFSSAADVGCA